MFCFALGITQSDQIPFRRTLSSNEKTQHSNLNTLIDILLKVGLFLEFELWYVSIEVVCFKYLIKNINNKNFINKSLKSSYWDGLFLFLETLYATENNKEVHLNFQDEECGIVNLSVGNDVVRKILISLSLSAKKYAR